MNTVLILAGGTGKRVGADIPKQYIKVDGTPIIIHTLKKFENSRSVDDIYIVSNPAWALETVTLCEEYNISKVKAVLFGGPDIYESTIIGLYAIEESHDGDTLVMIHEAVRPLITEDMIDDSFRVASEKGNAVASWEAIDEVGFEENQMMMFGKGMKTIQNPHTFKLDELIDAYEGSKDMAMNGTALLMHSLGEELHFSKGSPDNFKITYKEDIQRFKALRSLYM